MGAMNEAGEGQAVELVVVAPPGAPMLDASVQRLRELLVDNTDRLPGGWRLSVVDDPAAHVPSPGVALTAFVHPAPDAELAQLVAPLFEHAAPSPGTSTAWTTRLMGRRTALAALGGLGLATIAAACGGGSSNGASNTSKQSAGGTTPTTGESTSSSATSTTAGTTGVVLAPEMTEGPYYLDLNLVRSDITEDRSGAAFALRCASST
jgi:hypothetical protein